MRSCLLLLALTLTACQPNNSAPAASQEQETDWQPLFNGKTLKGWRGYNAETLPPGWKIEGDVLTFDDQDIPPDTEYEGGKDLIYAAEQFDNFELVWDWKIPPGGNSGLLYHVREGYDGPYKVGPEYQMIDDLEYTKYHDISEYNAGLGYGPELQDWQSTGADYAMYPAPLEDRNIKPAGEWNTSRIVFTPERAEYWLNGKLVVDFVPWSDDWQQRRDSGKWTNAPDYGKFRSGYIALQDHDSPLWFRNIKIKRL